MVGKLLLDLMPFLMLNVEAFLNRSIKTAVGFSNFLIISSLRIKNEKRIPLHRNYKLLLMITKFMISRLTLMGITLTEALFLSMSSLSLINSLTLNASIYENPMLVMKTYKFYLFILDFSMVSRTKRVKLKAVSNLEWHRKNRYKYNPSSTLFSNPYFISSIPQFMIRIKSESWTPLSSITIDTKSLKEKLKLIHKLSRFTQFFMLDLPRFKRMYLRSIKLFDHRNSKSESQPHLTLLSSMYFRIVMDSSQQRLQFRCSRMFRFPRQVLTLCGAQSKQTERRHRLQMCSFVKTPNSARHNQQLSFKPRSILWLNSGRLR